MESSWPVIALVQLVLLLAVVGFVAARLRPLIAQHMKGSGGWDALAARFKVEPRSGSGLRSRQSVQVGRVLYRNCVTVGVDAHGLYLEARAPIPFFRKPPLLIPWSEISRTDEARLFWQKAALLSVGEPVLGTVTLPADLFESVRPRLSPRATLGTGVARITALVCCLAGLPFALAGPLSAQDVGAEAVAQCFTGTALEALKARPGDDELSRNLAEMAAGRHCHEVVAAVTGACVASVAERRDDPAAYYLCIGIAANPCIESQWATNEFRRVVCMDAEESFWLASLQADLEALRAVLDDKARASLDALEQAHFGHRNEKCGLARSIYDKNGPHAAYGACATEAAARTAIDLKVLRSAVSARERKP